MPENSVVLEFVNEMHEFVLIVEPDSTIKYANKAFYSFYGVTADDISGKKVLDFLIPEDRNRCDMENVVTPEYPDYQVEGRTIGPDGQIKWIQYVGKGYFDETGNLMEFREVGNDITKWKEKIEDTVALLKEKSENIYKITLEDSQTMKSNIAKKLSGNVATYTFNDFITRNKKIETLIIQAKSIAKQDSSILIEGESGTGKEIIAQSIHNSSNRARGPFIALNCGAIPPELINSELFGYASGAFTGASKSGKPGKFELADKGTLFLDEIGEMPLAQQVSLLRVLETKTVNRIGDDKTISIDVRIICATNKNLFAEVQNGQFREDLFFRINVINLFIPPLRERKDDLYLLVENIIKRLSNPDTDINVDDLFQKHSDKLYSYDWPGNVRELQNVVERLINMPNYDLNILLGNQKFIKNRTGVDNTGLTDNRKILGVSGDFEKKIVLDKLRECRGNVTMAARELNVSRKTLYKRINQYKIDYKEYALSSAR